MDIIAWVSNLGNFLGKKFDSLSWVAEDDGLIDLEFAEKCVQTMNLLLFLYVSVILSNSNEGKFLKNETYAWEMV